MKQIIYHDGFPETWGTSHIDRTGCTTAVLVLQMILDGLEVLLEMVGNEYIRMERLLATMKLPAPFPSKV
jgi:hypothetical protein